MTAGYVNMTQKLHLPRRNSSHPHVRCAIMLGMRFLPISGFYAQARHDSDTMGAAASAGESGEDFVVEDSNLLKTVGWISAALGAVALGLLVGREIRQRYKFNRRTPYDLYSHSGDELPDVDCGVGI